MSSGSSFNFRMAAGLVVLLILVAVIGTLEAGVMRIFIVISGSMEPSLQIGDRILVDGNATPDRYDIVNFQDPTKPGEPEEQLVKRVIGVEGDLIELRSGILYINKKEQYSNTVTSNRINWDDIRLKVPDGHVFVLGDNRNNSFDSLNFGTIEIEDIEGVLSIVLWPPSHWGSLPAFD